MKRATAIRLHARDVAQANYIPAGDANPQTLIITPDGTAASRVMLAGVAKDIYFNRENRFAAFKLRDDTGEVACRFFRDGIEKVESIAEGDLVKVAGKVRHYNGENYVIPEVVRKLDNPLWLQVHALEVKMRSDGKKQAADRNGMAKRGEARSRKKAEENDKEKAEGETTSAEERVLALIRKLDDGGGVKYITLLNESGLPEDELELALSVLMEEGKIYEPKIGRFRCIDEVQGDGK